MHGYHGDVVLGSSVPLQSGSECQSGSAPTWIQLLLILTLPPPPLCTYTGRCQLQPGVTRIVTTHAHNDGVVVLESSVPPLPHPHTSTSVTVGCQSTKPMMQQAH